MIFFRQKLEEVITLPPPPKDDMKEALQVRDIVNVRTPEQVQSVEITIKILILLLRELLKNIN